MSIATHKAARDAFYALETMDTAERLDALADEDSEYHWIPCSAGLTAVLFRRLDVDNDERDVYWLKLFDRPVARVFKLWMVAKDAKPEQLKGLFTAFSKKVKPLGILEVPE